MAYLRISLNNSLQRRLELNADALTIGRAADNDLIFDAPGVSAHHAVILKEKNAYYLVDRGSTNGVFVNGDQVNRHKLKYWDEIQIYNYVLRFMASAGLHNESEVEMPMPSASTEFTQAFAVSDIDDLLKMRDLDSDAVLQWLDQDGSENTLTIDAPIFSIGKGLECDLHADHWFAPRLAAYIERRRQGYYLNPTRWGRVLINGRKINVPTLLHDSDTLQIAGLQLRFHNKAAWSGLSA